MYLYMNFSMYVWGTDGPCLFGMHSFLSVCNKIEMYYSVLLQ